MALKDIFGRQARKNERLIDAAWKGDLEAVRRALDKGAQADALVGEHCALHVTHSPEVMALLIARGAKVDNPSAAGSTALLYHARVGNDAAVKLLIEKGADVDARNHMGWSPLGQAAEYGNAGAVEMLIAHHANMNASDHHGWTACHHAARKGHNHILEILVRRGANIHAQDVAGETPLSIAEKHRLDDTAAMLKGEKEWPGKSRRTLNEVEAKRGCTIGQNICVRKPIQLKPK